MIVVSVVVGIAVALCVAGWVPLVRDALRADHVLPGPGELPTPREIVAAAGLDTTPEPEAVTA